jgi:hypothetical protein
MPGPVNQFVLTPNLADRPIKLQRAQQAYTQQVLPVTVMAGMAVPIGANFSSSQYARKLTTDLSPTGQSAALSSIMCGVVVKPIKEAYQKIINDLTGNEPGNDPIDVITQKNPALQKDVLKLTQERDSLLEDQQVAELRDNVLRSGNTAISNHQVYMLGRPLRPASMPYLWTLSVLFIGLAVLILYMFFPFRAIPFDILLFDIMLFFKNPKVWATLFGLASIVIAFLVLHITGVL